MNTDLQRITLDTLRGIQAEKRRQNRFLDHVMLIEDNPFKNVQSLCSRSEFNEVLEELRDWGVIEIGPTINDTYLRVVDFEEKESSL